VLFNKLNYNKSREQCRNLEEEGGRGNLGASKHLIIGNVKHYLFIALHILVQCRPFFKDNGNVTSGVEAKFSHPKDKCRGTGLLGWFSMG
jgi:hypothetical protein